MKVKVAFSDFWNNFDRDDFLITKILHKICDVEFTDMRNADILFFSVFGEKHWKASDDCVKIFFTGENITPDFNACDYAIGFDYLDFGDRYLRFPLYYMLSEETNDSMENKHHFVKEELMAQKTQFCSITVSNSKRHLIFSDLFDLLSQYKQVDSGGRWKNNIGGPVQDKFAFDSKHKFSIVCENCSYPGYTTEKIVQAFAAKCIPIYWGDPLVGNMFDKRAFINVADYDSVEDVVRLVRKIDENDELYLEMMSQPALVDDQYKTDAQTENLYNFLSHIFNQKKEERYRRNRIYWGKKYLKNRRLQVRSSSTIFYRPFWDGLAKKILGKK